MVGGDGPGDQQRHDTQHYRPVELPLLPSRPYRRGMPTPQSPLRLAHAELATPHEMYDDCRAVTRNLGLSQAIVSMALSSRPGVSAETRKRVRAEAERLQPGSLLPDGPCETLS